MVYSGTCIHYFPYFCSKNIDCGYSLEPLRRGGTNEYPQPMFWVEIWKKYQNILSEKFHHFLVVKVSVYLNRHVFEYPLSKFWSRTMKNIKIFYLKKNHFLVVKVSVYLNRHVFVMTNYPNLHLGRSMRKRVFGFMQTVQAQISLLIRSVWSGPLLSAYRIIG